MPGNVKPHTALSPRRNLALGIRARLQDRLSRAGGGSSLHHDQRGVTYLEASWPSRILSCSICLFWMGMEPLPGGVRDAPWGAFLLD
jgi:hypothetical protein